MNLAIIYGSDTGNTEVIANQLHEYYPDAALLNVTDVSAEQMTEYSHLILGIPTWNDGELQGDWEDIFEDLPDHDYAEQTVAIFGLGDQQGYPFTFLDAAGMLHDQLKEKGAKMVGYWSTEGYDYSESVADTGEDSFVCLAIDFENQEDMNEDRLEKWVEQLASEGFSA